MNIMLNHPIKDLALTQITRENNFVSETAGISISVFWVVGRWKGKPTGPAVVTRSFIKDL